MKVSKVFVSIVVPCYNAEKYILDTIKSVCKQTYENWEMIIVDDKSTDNSLEIIEKYTVNNQRIKVLCNSINMGVAKSRNIAIEIAQGKYIAFLDSDDLWFSTKLEKQIHFMEEKNILFSYSAYNIINKLGEIQSDLCVPLEVNYDDMLRSSQIGTLTMIYNADILGKFYFNSMGHEDYILKLQILKKIKVAYGLNEILASYRVLENSLSSNKLSAAQWQWNIYRNIEKLSLLKSIYYFIQYAYNGFMKYKG